MIHLLLRNKSIVASTFGRTPIEAQIAALSGEGEKAKVEKAYLEFIQINPTDLRSLSDFGSFSEPPHRHPSCTCRLPVFERKDGRLFSGNYGQIFKSR